MHTYMTEEEIQAAEQKVQAAHKVVSELCHGERCWTMSVPAEPERDSDLVIDSGLRVSERALADVRELRRVVGEMAQRFRNIESMCSDMAICGEVNAALALARQVEGGK